MDSGEEKAREAGETGGCHCECANDLRTGMLDDFLVWKDLLQVCLY